MSDFKEFNVTYYFANGHKLDFVEVATNEEELTEFYGEDSVRAIATDEKFTMFNMKDVVIIEASRN